eukprot:GHVR01059958.1.p1 GENE.GHVR01059958.1~~GHVR01059958.1.p1  ORF type:complete len:260 (+),score=94.08 GHVR01059958.1:142-921(+)
MRALTGKSVVVPGDFKAAVGDGQAVRCSNKAQDGLLYPLQKQLLFVHKPVLLVRYEDILSAEFSHTASSTTRYFEIKICCRGGGELDFSSIDRHELSTIVQFLQSRNVKTRSADGSDLTDTHAHTKRGTGKPTGDGYAEELPSDDDEDDEDFEAEQDEPSSEDVDESEDEQSDDHQEKAKDKDKDKDKDKPKDKHKHKHKKDKKTGGEDKNNNDENNNDENNDDNKKKKKRSKDRSTHDKKKRKSEKSEKREKKKQRTE